MIHAQKSETILLPCLWRIGQIAHCWWGQIFFQISQTWVKDWPREFSLSLTIFFYAGWHQMIVMETTYLQRVEMYYCGGYVPLFWGRYSFRAHRCEWKIGPDKSVYIITLFLCRMLSDVWYENCIIVDEDYYGEYVLLFATIRCWSSTCVLLDVVVNHWIVVMYYYE